MCWKQPIYLQSLDLQLTKGQRCVMVWWSLIRKVPYSTGMPLPSSCSSPRNIKKCFKPVRLIPQAPTMHSLVTKVRSDWETCPKGSPRRWKLGISGAIRTEFSASNGILLTRTCFWVEAGIRPCIFGMSGHAPQFISYMDATLEEKLLISAWIKFCWAITRISINFVFTIARLEKWDPCNGQSQVCRKLAWLQVLWAVVSGTSNII